MTAAQADEDHGDKWDMSINLHIDDKGYIHQFQPKPVVRIH